MLHRFGLVSLVFAVAATVMLLIDIELTPAGEPLHIIAAVGSGYALAVGFGGAALAKVLEAKRELKRGSHE